MSRLFLIASVVGLVAFGVAMAWLVVHSFRSAARSMPPPVKSELADSADVRSEVLEHWRDAAPKPTGAPIRLYRISPPDCPYEELALVRVSTRGRGTDGEVRGALREAIEIQARQLGGDAVAGLQEYETTEVRSGTGMIALGFPHWCWSGVVLRFQDPDCAH